MTNTQKKLWEPKVGDHAAIRYYSDVVPCTVIKRTAKFVWVQRDKYKLQKDWKPDIIQVPYNIFDRRIQTSGWLAKLKKKSEGILIKLPKKKQDLRMDLPTIGLQTFIDIKKYGLRGVVLQSKKNIFLDKVECIKFANKNKIFINII